MKLLKRKYTSIKLNLVAGKVVPTPSISSILSQKNINIHKFCTEYNKQTSQYLNINIPVSITICDNKIYNMSLHYPTIIYLITKYSYNGYITFNTLKKILNLKIKELNNINYKKLLSIIKNILQLKKIKIILN